MPIATALLKRYRNSYQTYTEKIKKILLIIFAYKLTILYLCKDLTVKPVTVWKNFT